jgi:hypothetical protein
MRTTTACVWLDGPDGPMAWVEADGLLNAAARPPGSHVIFIMGSKPAKNYFVQGITRGKVVGVVGPRFVNIASPLLPLHLFIQESEKDIYFRGETGLHDPTQALGDI